MQLIFFLPPIHQNTQMAKGKGKYRARGGGSVGGNNRNLVLVLLAIGIVGLGIVITMQERFSSPSKSGGHVSGSGPGMEPKTTEPPFSQRQLLLPHPTYEMSHPPDAHPRNWQLFHAKNRLGHPMYRGRPDVAVPTFAGPGDYRKVGFVYSRNDDDGVRLPLYGRPTYPGGNRFEYYVLDDSVHFNEIPIGDHNGLELLSGNLVRVPGYRDDLTAHIYYDSTN